MNATFHALTVTGIHAQDILDDLFSLSFLFLFLFLLLGILSCASRLSKYIWLPMYLLAIPSYH